MKHKTVIIIIILGFLLLVSLCKTQIIEGLDEKKKNVSALNRGEYIDDTSYLKSKDGSYSLKLRKGKLLCRTKTNGKLSTIWTMNAKGSKMMLLNNYGLLQFKMSKKDEYIPITKEITGSKSVVLTAYGTLELKNAEDGNGDTLWTYPLVEGLDPADKALIRLMDDVRDERTALTKHTAYALDQYLTDGVAGGTNYKFDPKRAKDWNDLTAEIDIADPDDYSTVVNGDYAALVNDKIHSTNDNDDHATLLQNTRKMRRLRNNLDNKIKVLNQLGDSHVTEKQLQLDSTIYISLAWTVVASSLVYYTLTQ
jgi:hypothetical protein